MSDQGINKREAADILGVTPSSIAHWVKLGYLQADPEAPQRIDGASVEQLKSLLADGTVPKLRARANKSQAGSFFIPYALAETAEQNKFIKLMDYIRSRHLPQAAVLFTLALNLAKNSGQKGARPGTSAGKAPGNEPLAEAMPAAGGIPVAIWKALLSGEPELVSANCLHLSRKSSLSFSEALAVQLCEYRIFLEGSGVWPRDFWREQEREWRELLFWDLPRIPDVLGVVYQVLTRENIKVRQGVYFTPQHAVDAMTADNWARLSNVFDPCCGTGKFLLSFAAQGAQPENLWGMDIDPVAVYLARINLLLFYRRPFVPRIYCGNSLKTEDWHESLRAMLGCFDVVATNPPWGASMEESDLEAWRARLPGYGKGKVFGHESFSLFLALGLLCLRPGGRLSYLLPEALLMIKRHEDIRRYLLAKCSLKNISFLGNIFHKVASPVIRLDAVKKTPEEEVAGKRTAEKKKSVKGNSKTPDITSAALTTDEVMDGAQEANINENWNQDGAYVEQVPRQGKKSSDLATRKSLSLHIDQQRFACNEDAVFDAWTSAEDKLILDKIQCQPCQTLAGHAQWVLGIVTGDNARFLTEKAEYGAEGVLCGSDVSAFALQEPNRYLIFRPDKLQQVAQESLYRTPKLVYRFIASRPVVAYDALGRLTLNSANSVIVQPEFFPARVVEALFNTRLYAYIFYHRFHTHKVLRAHLERLPLPCWPAARLNMLAEMAERLGALGESEMQRTLLLDELDHEVMRGFGLNFREQARVTALCGMITTKRLKNLKPS